MEETFRIIKGFENYEVSNFGRVKNNKTGRILIHSIGNHGYYKVSLCSDGDVYQKLIHKLVAEYFIANTYNKPFVDHINNNKLEI